MGPGGGAGIGMVERGKNQDLPAPQKEHEDFANRSQEKRDEKEEGKAVSKISIGSNCRREWSKGSRGALGQRREPRAGALEGAESCTNSWSCRTG